MEQDSEDLKHSMGEEGVGEDPETDLWEFPKLPLIIMKKAADLQ